MPFKGITFAGQNVTPKNDGGLYNAHYGDGILWGCSMNISGDDLVIQSGEFIAGGRVCQVDGATNVDLSTRTLTNGYIQVVMDFDISKPEGSQWNIHLPLIESATTTFPALTKDDINDTGTLYQLELAVVQISGGNLTSITSSLDPSKLVSDGILEFYKNGVLVAKIDQVNWSGACFTATSPNGNSLGGLRVEPGYGMDLMALDGNPIHFRPNGNSNTHMYYLDNDGFHCNDDGGMLPSTGTEDYLLNQAFTFGGRACTYNVYKWGRFCTLALDMGNGTAFNTGNAVAFTLASKYRPIATVFGNGLGRTSGAWASATYYPFNISINSSGAVQIASNENNFKSCTYAVGGITFLCAK